MVELPRNVRGKNIKKIYKNRGIKPELLFFFVSSYLGNKIYSGIKEFFIEEGIPT